MKTSPPSFKAAPMTARSMALLVLISVLYFVLVRDGVGEPISGDLRALWHAGTFFPSGEIGSVYRLYDGVFSMLPPDIWVTTVQEQRIETPVYPFIYPPLWAWVMSLIVPLTTMDEFSRIMAIINPCLIILSALLAMRIAAPQIPRPVYFAISMAIALTSLVFLLPLVENQPQILVSFLILLGIERARSGAPVAGSLAMALAASLKLYPLIFALIWLAAGQRRATLWFAVFGAALGGLSIIAAGWPMHVAFLSELSSISNTALLSRANYSLDPLIAILTIPSDAFSVADTSVTGGDTSWQYIAKSQTWSLASMGVQMTTLLALLVLAYRTQMRAPLLWPFVMIAVAWVSPLSWIYHYIGALFFLPSLFDRFGLRKGLLFLVLILAPYHLLMLRLGITTKMETLPLVLWNNAVLLFAAGLFLLIGLRSEQSERF